MMYPTYPKGVAFNCPFRAALCLLLVLGGIVFTHGADSSENLWTLGRRHQDIHRFSTLFTAQDVRNHLSTDEGHRRGHRLVQEDRRDQGLHRVVPRRLPGRARGAADRPRSASRPRASRSPAASRPPRSASAPPAGTSISCYTDRPTQEKLQAIFEYAAGLFDEIMIDDFWFTDCACPECDAARAAKTVTIGGSTLSRSPATPGRTTAAS